LIEREKNTLKLRLKYEHKKGCKMQPEKSKIIKKAATNIDRKNWVTKTM